MEKISVIIPCYNEEQTLPLFYEELKKNLNTIENVDFELIFINDGSTDNTLDTIKKLCNTNSKIKYISFSRNFGKESAIFAGLENSTGDFVTIIDADLQDPPCLLPKMYKMIQEEDLDAIRNSPNQSQRRTCYSKLFCQNVL